LCQQQTDGASQLQSPACQASRVYDNHCIWFLPYLLRLLGLEITLKVDFKIQGRLAAFSFFSVCMKKDNIAGVSKSEMS